MDHHDPRLSRYYVKDKRILEGGSGTSDVISLVDGTRYPNENAARASVSALLAEFDPDCAMNLNELREAIAQ